MTARTDRDKETESGRETETERKTEREKHIQRLRRRQKALLQFIAGNVAQCIPVCSQLCVKYGVPQV